MTDPTTIAPGWYDDGTGNGTQRYWDGTQWSDVPSQPAVPAPPAQIPVAAYEAAPAAGGPASAAPVAKERNTLGIVAIALAAFGFIFACIPGALIIGWIALPIAFVLSIVALFLKGKGKGLAISALIVSIVGTIVGVVVFLAVVATSFSTAFDETAGSDTQTVAPKASQAAAAAPAKAQPFNASGLLGGNANPTFPAGDPGKVSVVAEAPLDNKGAAGATLSFAYRNNTSAAISHVDFTATARVDGKLLASGTSQGSIPAQVKPGEIGLAYIFFEDASSIPATGVTYEFTAKTTPADTSFFNTAPLTVSEANGNGTSIVGTAVNKTGKPLSGPYSVQAYCFDGNNLTTSVMSFADQTSDIAADAKVSFTVSLFDTKCDKFTIGVSGYFQ